MSDDQSNEPEVPAVPEVPAKPASPYDKYADFIANNAGYKSIFQSDNIGMGNQTPKTK